MANSSRFRPQRAFYYRFRSAVTGWAMSASQAMQQPASTWVAMRVYRKRELTDAELRRARARWERSL